MWQVCEKKHKAYLFTDCFKDCVFLFFRDWLHKKNMMYIMSNSKWISPLSGYSFKEGLDKYGKSVIQSYCMNMGGKDKDISCMWVNKNKLITWRQAVHEAEKTMDMEL
jgi:hypothetical protein